MFLHSARRKKVPNRKKDLTKPSKTAKDMQAQKNAKELRRELKLLLMLC